VNYYVLKRKAMAGAAAFSNKIERPFTSSSTAFPLGRCFEK
jgi:hypothetical protein